MFHKIFNFYHAAKYLPLDFLWRYIQHQTLNNQECKYKVNYLINKSIEINNGINICLISDENYLIPLAVTLQSIKENRDKENIYNIFVLFTGQNREVIFDIQGFSEHSFYIKVLPIRFNTFSLRNWGHVSPATYIKFDIPKIFKGLNKILYLDTDIIVLKDLASLYDIDISDYYIGGIKDIGCYAGRFYFGLRFKEYILNYFNAGILLLNLDKFRREGLSDILYDSRLKNPQHLADQDAFNIYCSLNTKYIDWKYNVFPHHTMRDIPALQRFFPEVKSNDNKNDICICHFAGSKPWRNKNLLFADKWYLYYNNLPDIIKNKYKMIK